jgi:hypothetical protein
LNHLDLSDFVLMQFVQSLYYLNFFFEIFWYFSVFMLLYLHLCFLKIYKYNSHILAKFLVLTNELCHSKDQMHYGSFPTKITFLLTKYCFCIVLYYVS